VHLLARGGAAGLNDIGTSDPGIRFRVG
jgi:hypothetical protein